MKKKIIINFIAIITILLLSFPVLAANTTTQSNSSTTATSTNSKKSSNTNLSNLGISPNDFSGFKESKTEYSVTVQNKTAEIEVYATPKDNKSKVTGTGKVKINEGDNAVKVTVTAEDGSTKTYTINVKRLKSGEKGTGTSAPNTTSVELNKLEIAGLKLEPEFSKDTHQYKVEYDGNEKKLNIVAEASEANARVEIVGNDQLINGQNVVTIIVTDAKEKRANTYQIYINKNLVSQEELNKQIDDANLQYNIKLWIARILIALITICIIVLLMVLYKRQKSEEYQQAKKEKRADKREKLKEKNKSKREKAKKKKIEEEQEEIEKEEKNGKHKRKH